MTMIGIYDDRCRVADEARAVLGIARYGRLVFRKRSLRDHHRDLLLAAGCERVVVIEDDADFDRLAHERGLERSRLLWWPSSLACRDQTAGRLFLLKFHHVQEDFSVAPAPGGTSSALLALGGASARRILVSDPLRSDLAGRGPGETMVAVPAPPWLADLTRRDQLVDLASSTFDVRHFNAISQDELLVVKRSSDVTKMRREARYYEQLPSVMRVFFLPALDYREEGGTACYATERIRVPDLSLQWIHRALDERSFPPLLGRLGDFLRLRPVRTPDAAAGRRQAEALYLGKTEQRLAQLSAHAAWPQIAALLAHCGPADGMAGLHRRFLAQWARLTPRRRVWRTAVSHGDPCFSNILYHPDTRLLKFIDPRGAETPDELHLDEYYDVAKLSHSILGLYDLVNHDLADLHLGRALHLELVHGGADLAPLQAQFRAAVAAWGLDLHLVRLYEAALFLSMLPLHADVPKKVVCFALTAADILARLERDEP